MLSKITFPITLGLIKYSLFCELTVKKIVLKNFNVFAWENKKLAPLCHP